MIDKSAGSMAIQRKVLLIRRPASFASSRNCEAAISFDMFEASGNFAVCPSYNSPPHADKEC